MTTLDRTRLSRLARAGLLTALSDGLFATFLSVVVYHSTVSRLWQGVAGVLLGPATFEGGTRTALIGVFMHVGVAFGWSTVFLLLFERSTLLRDILDTPHGVLKVAAAYGPCVWLVMSLVVIPFLVHRPPTISLRWWIVLIGHAPFVGIPIVASIGASGRHDPRGN